MLWESTRETLFGFGPDACPCAGACVRIQVVLLNMFSGYVCLPPGRCCSISFPLPLSSFSLFIPLFLSLWESVSSLPRSLHPVRSALSLLPPLFSALLSFFCPAVSYTGVGCGVRINSFRILESWWDSGTCCEAVFISLLAALAQVLKLLNHFDMRAHVWICVYLPAGRSGTCYGALESIWHSCTCLEAPLRRGMDLNEPV